MTTAFDQVALPTAQDIGQDIGTIDRFLSEMHIFVEQLKIGEIKVLDKACSGFPVPDNLIRRVFVYRLPVDSLNPSVIFDFLEDGTVLSSDENDREFSRYDGAWNWESACSQILVLFKNVHNEVLEFEADWARNHPSIAQ